VDIALIHDPDEHWSEAIDGAYPALEHLRSEGRVTAIGVGMNQAPMLARFAREGDFDVLLLANRYTLLNQEALDEVLPGLVDAAAPNARQDGQRPAPVGA
jgi:D-threo-aldose 1-dehydrogenase